MANTVSILSYANTFGDWVVTTNGLARENNNLASNNYIKGTGTLFLNDTSLGLQIANNAIIGGTLQSAGLGSSVTIQNNLTVSGTSNVTNTNVTGTLNVTGALNVNGNALDPVYIGNVNTTQNNQISAVNSYAAGAYSVANTAGTTAASALTLATTDAANIILVNQYAASAYALANTNATNITAVNGLAQGAYNKANSVVFSITGTTNQVVANNSTGNVLLSLPQNIDSNANVQHGSIGVGTSPDSANTGSIRAINNITAYYSDDRLKTRLGTIENALDKVSSLTGFYHEANEIAQSLGYQPIREVGVSAQDVQKVMPEVVAPAPIDDKYLTVRYERLVPLLIEAIKELRSELDELKAKQ